MKFTPVTRWRGSLASALSAWLLLSPTGFVGAAVHPASSSALAAGRDLNVQTSGDLQLLAAYSQSRETTQRTTQGRKKLETLNFELEQNRALLATLTAGNSIDLNVGGNVAAQVGSKDAEGNLQADRMTATGVIKGSDRQQVSLTHTDDDQRKSLRDKKGTTTNGPTSKVIGNLSAQGIRSSANDSFAPEAVQQGQAAVAAMMQNGLLTIANQPALQATLNAPAPNGGALTYKDDSGRVTLTLAGEARVQAVYNQLKLTETFDVKHFADQGTAQVVTLVAAIALTVMSGGTGAALVGATSAAGSAAANAAFIAMVSTMTGQLAAGASFDQAFQTALKAGTTSAITAGILNTQMIDTAQGMQSINQLANVQTAGANIVGNFNADTLGQNLLGIGARGVVNAGVSTAMYGGSFGDAFRGSVVGDLAVVGANAVGQGTPTLSLQNIIAHAAIGGAAAKLTGGGAAAGAIGGAGAAINPLLDRAIGGADGSGWGSNPETAQQWQTATLQLGSMAASAAAAAALGQDGMTAALAAQNETVNNYLSQKRTSPPALSEQEQLNEALKRGDTAKVKQLMELSATKDKLLADVCGSGSPQGCNAEVRAAIDAGNIVMRTADGRVIAIPADSPVIKAPDRPVGFDTQLAPSLADAILMEGTGILLKGASFVGARLIGVSGEGFVPGVGVANTTGRAAATEASSALQGAQLGEHLRQLEKYGEAGYRELHNGRIRYYGEITPARNAGEMAGARLVREWDPATNAARTWYETLDHTGTIRSVAPKPVIEPLNHRIFDANGNYTGRR